MDLYSPDGLPPTSPHVFHIVGVNTFTSIKLNVMQRLHRYDGYRDQ